MEIPSVWLWVSGIFFAFGILTHIVLIGVLLKLQKSVEEMKPKIEKLADEAKQTSEKVHGIAKNVEGTTDLIRSKTEHIFITAATAVETVAGRLTTVSTILGLVLAAARAKGELSRIKEKREEDARKRKEREAKED